MVHWLPHAECAENTAVSETTKCTPFWAVDGMDPRLSSSGVPTQERDQRCLNVNQVYVTMQSSHEHLGVQMRSSLTLQPEGADLGHVPGPNIQVRSKVRLDGRNKRTSLPSWKWDWKQLGLYVVSGRVSPYTYELLLPGSIRIHRVQLVSLLDFVVNTSLIWQQIFPHPPV